MSVLDDALREIRAALRTPFADPVDVAGIPLPRATVRAMERGLLRERVTQRRTLSPPSGLTLSPERPGALPADAVVQTSKGAAASAGFLSSFHEADNAR